MRIALAFLLLAAVAGGQQTLVICIDDVGNESIDCYGEGDPARQPPTPAIDGLAAQGVRFTRFWSMPMCSPTRASVLTGRYPWRHGIGSVATPGRDLYLQPSEVTLPEALGGIYAAHVGKWHVGEHWGALDPIVHGHELHVGTRRNIQDYEVWTREIAVPWFADADPMSSYAGGQTTDDALSLLAALSGQWHVTASYHLGHSPLHAPPGYDGPLDDLSLYMAMVSRLDSEVGRLLAGVDLETTTVILYGDNGAHSDVSEWPGKAKQTVYEPGINCPLIVAGAAVPTTSRGAVATTLAVCTDLYATVLALHQRPSVAEDSISLLPALADPGAQLREVVYSERWRTEEQGGAVDIRAARDERWKLVADIVRDRWALYDLAGEPPIEPPAEVIDTSEEQAAYDALLAVIMARGG